MIEWFISTAMLTELLILSAFLLLGRRGIKKNLVGMPFTSSTKWPQVAMIVPATGASKELVHCLNSLLSQDYPAYQALFVTRDLADPATPIIRQLIQGHPHARHIYSGKSTACSQKNHNLLAGIKEIGDSPEILVFCDSTRLASPNWLKELVWFIAKNESLVTSGYHHVIPRDWGFTTLGRTISVLIFYLIQGTGWFTQPWGGNTAIRRTAFEALEVDKLWDRNVVDDVSLAALIKKAKINVRLAPDACLLTHLANETLTVWSHWLTRQILYLKFCLPGSWLIVGIICHLLAGLVLVAGVQCFGTFLDWTSPAMAFFSVLYLFLLTTLAAALRPLHPKPGPLLRWLVAAYTTIFMISWCHLKTLFAKRIHWSGITYRVTWGGKVVKIEET